MRATAQGRIWISMGADTLSELEGLSTLEEPEIESVEDGVALLRVARSELPAISDLLTTKLRRIGGFVAHESREAEDGSRAPEGTARSSAASAPEEYTVDNAEVVTALESGLNPTNILDVMTTLSSYVNRNYDARVGVVAAQRILNSWQEIIAPREDATAEFFQHAGFLQPSVLVTLAGSSLPEEVVVIGGHIDSVAGAAGERAPGADDNGSGLAVVTEALRAAIANDYRPERTVKFIGYAGEEAGLLGSQEIAASFSRQRVHVYGVLNLDMTCYKGSDVDFWLAADYVNSNHTAFVADLVETYQDAAWRLFSCGYGCSDHYSWNAQGYPVSFPFESSMEDHNPYIHTRLDTVLHCTNGAEHSLKFARLAVAYLAEAAKGSVATGAE